MSGELLSPSKKQSITNKNISKQKTIKQNVLLYILLFLLLFLNGESNSESHDVSFLFASFLLFLKERKLQSINQLRYQG